LSNTKIAVPSSALRTPSHASSGGLSPENSEQQNGEQPDRADQQRARKRQGPIQAEHEPELIEGVAAYADDHEPRQIGATDAPLRGFLSGPPRQVRQKQAR
jgi:hypothetical protein